MSIIAPIDRYEGDVSVLPVGDEESVVNVPRSDLLPEARQGDIVCLEVIIDPEATERRRESVRAKIEPLKRRSEDG